MRSRLAPHSAGGQSTTAPTHFESILAGDVLGRVPAVLAARKVTPANLGEGGAVHQAKEGKPF